MSMNQEQPSMMNQAMNFGAVAGLYYIVKFCIFPLSLHSTMAAFLFLGLTLVVPFFIYQLVKRYRDLCCGGRIEFARAAIFSVLTMGFASLLAAVAHYVYFAFIDGGAVVVALAQSIDQLQSVDFSSLEGVNADSVAQFNQYVELMQGTMRQLQAMSPIDMTIGMLGNNASWSIILSLPIALVVSLNIPKKTKE